MSNTIIFSLVLISTTQGWEFTQGVSVHNLSTDIFELELENLSDLTFESDLFSYMTLFLSLPKYNLHCKYISEGYRYSIGILPIYQQIL